MPKAPQTSHQVEISAYEGDLRKGTERIVADALQSLANDLQRLADKLQRLEVMIEKLEQRLERLENRT